MEQLTFRQKSADSFFRYEQRDLPDRSSYRNDPVISGPQHIDYPFTSTERQLLCFKREEGTKRYEEKQKKALDHLDKTVAEFSQENLRLQARLKQIEKERQKCIDEAEKSNAEVNELIQNANASLAKSKEIIEQRQNQLEQQQLEKTELEASSLLQYAFAQVSYALSFFTTQDN